MLYSVKGTHGQQPGYKEGRLADSQINLAVERLRQGGLVAFPTDTLYALGADPFNPQAVQRVFWAKHRPPNMGLPLLLSDAAMLTPEVAEASELALELAERFWPGPLTMLLPRGPMVSEQVTGGQDSVAVRVPDHPIAQRLIGALGHPVTGTSANVTGGDDPATAQQVREHMGASCDMVLDDGASQLGVSSTIVDLTGPRPTLVRAGAVPWEDIESFLASGGE